MPPDELVLVERRNGVVHGPGRAGDFLWYHGLRSSDIMEYRTITEQADLEAAEQLLRANDYTIIPPAKPLTFDDVVPMT